MKIFLSFSFICLIGFLTSSTNYSDWKTIKTKKYSFDVPDYMTETEDLNSSASSQYMYVEEVDGTVQELYLIVLQETHKEIKKLKLGYEFDAMSYYELAVESMRPGLDSYEVLTKNPEVETINGMNCVKAEMRGTLGDVNVFYKLGVFHGGNAFYQVMTWTVEEQKDIFLPQMDKITNSFKEND